MKYLCLVYAEEKNVAAVPEAQLNEIVSDCLAYNDELSRSGHFVAAEALENVATAVTIRRDGGELAVTDGPFAETKEQLLGFFLLEARDRDEAVRLAARIPPLRVGCIEVRPVKELTGKK
jgi:hypothetical protein